MRVEQLNEEGWAKTYLVVDENTNEACLVDPVYDFTQSYLQLIDVQGLTLKYAISTHTHADHITGCFTLKDETGCEYVMWKETASMGVSKYVDESSILEFAGDSFKFHHVPGHTADSMIVEIGSHIFTGDFLFTGPGGVGRDDLPSGRMKDHWNSIGVLSRFSGDVMVLTGHDPPGTQMQTLDWNRSNNPILKMKSWEQYRDWQNESVEQLGYVSKIKVALPANIFGELPDAIPWLD
jgi:glyoxylase-like metal-dependent hydrolase (beta-lactamase superfamily II)